MEEKFMITMVMMDACMPDDAYLADPTVPAQGRWSWNKGKAFLMNREAAEAQINQEVAAFTAQGYKVSASDFHIEPA